MGDWVVGKAEAPKLLSGLAKEAKHRSAVAKLLVNGAAISAELVAGVAGIGAISVGSPSMIAAGAAVTAAATFAFIQGSRATDRLIVAEEAHESLADSMAEQRERRQKFGAAIADKLEFHVDEIQGSGAELGLAKVMQKLGARRQSVFEDTQKLFEGQSLADKAKRWIKSV